MSNRLSSLLAPAALAVSLGTLACSGSEAVQSTPSAGGRGSAPSAAVPVNTALVAEKADAARAQRDWERRGVFDRRGPRADHRRPDVGDLPRRRRRQEGPGALHARSPAARSGARAGARRISSATPRRRPTRNRRRSAIRTSPRAGSPPRNRSTRRRRRRRRSRRRSAPIARRSTTPPSSSSTRRLPRRSPAGPAR